MLTDNTRFAVIDIIFRPYLQIYINKILSTVKLSKKIYTSFWLFSHEKQSSAAITYPTIISMKNKYNIYTDAIITHIREAYTFISVMSLMLGLGLWHLGYLICPWQECPTICHVYPIPALCAVMYMTEISVTCALKFMNFWNFSLRFLKIAFRPNNEMYGNLLSGQTSFYQKILHLEETKQ